ncbi:lipase [Thraustotheca clavata]|uniref:Lipase n=1 Tax=Thraustotheca clavata TaxID=74557 RepID=A0A1V9ZSW4_9STRA|nr:lipase [Thraustotheca clavata]
MTHCVWKSLYVQSWLPKKKCKGIVILAHGMNEHSGYLQRLTESLLKAQYGVYAFDHEGFGRSSGTHALVNDYKQLVDDLKVHITTVQNTWPDKKVSFGGALILHALNTMNIQVDGVILQAPALQLHASRRPGPSIEIFGRFLAQLVPSLALLPSNGGKGSSKSVREQVSKQKKNDPLYYSGNVRLGTAFSIMSAIDDLQTPQVVANFQVFNTPLLLQHGDADVVCDLAGSLSWFSQLTNCNDKTMIPYAQACHDLLHEPESIATVVLSDCVAWLDQRS